MNAYFLKTRCPRTYARPCSYNIRMNARGNLHNISHQQRSRKQQLNLESLLDLVTLLVTAQSRRRTSDVFWAYPSVQYSIGFQRGGSGSHASHASSPKCSRSSPAPKARGATGAAPSTSILNVRRACRYGDRPRGICAGGRADVIQGMRPRSGMNGGEGSFRGGGIRVWRG